MTSTTGQDPGSSSPPDAEVMKLVRDYAATIGWAPEAEQAAAYAAVQAAVADLAARAVPAPKPATAWAVLDANGHVLSVQLSRVIAGCLVRDGGRVAPLVLAGHADVTDET